MSIFKVPKGVLKVMESIRSNFFKGASMLEKKISWIAWDKGRLGSKKKGGSGVSSYFALNRELPLKVVWRFRFHMAFDFDSEVQVLKSSGFDFLSYCSKRLGLLVKSTSYWKRDWMGDGILPLCELCRRGFASCLHQTLGGRDRFPSFGVRYQKGRMGRVVLFYSSSGFS
ncbi:hypothetical protein Tco_0473914 [Tanacetum coccineum]